MDKNLIISKYTRLLERKAQYNSAPTLFLNGEAVPQNPDQNQDTHLFKAHPVPSHVYKPLFDFIMLKNQRRYLKNLLSNF